MLVTCTVLGFILLVIFLASDLDFLKLCLGAGMGALGLRTESPQSVSEPHVTSAGSCPGLLTRGSLEYVNIISQPESGDDILVLSTVLSLSKLETDLPELHDSVGVSFVVDCLVSDTHLR